MTFIRWTRLTAAVGLACLLAACAHPISMEPKDLPERVESNLVQKKVAYVIADADLAKQVETAGGGGDKVSYFPYRDMEKAVRTALRSVYLDVTSAKSAAELPALKEAGVSYVFTPTITTSSSSPSPFTWPPTRFSTQVSCAVTDTQGSTLGTVMANGDGTAEFSEFKSDFSLAARRAAADVVVKLAQAIRDNEKLR